MSHLTVSRSTSTRPPVKSPRASRCQPRVGSIPLLPVPRPLLQSLASTGRRTPVSRWPRLHRLQRGLVFHGTQGLPGRARHGLGSHVRPTVGIPEVFADPWVPRNPRVPPQCRPSAPPAPLRCVGTCRRRRPRRQRSGRARPGRPWVPWNQLGHRRVAAPFDDPVPLVVRLVRRAPGLMLDGLRGRGGHRPSACAQTLLGSVSSARQVA